MSRLINADALVDCIESIDWYHTNRNGVMVHGANSDEDVAWYKADDIYKAIEEQSTVDSIPIKYIQKRIDELAEDIRCYGGIAEYEGLTDAYCAESVALKALIERWRECKMEWLEAEVDE